MKQKVKYYTVQFIAALFIFLFTYTAISKLSAFQGFVFGISRHPFLHPVALFVAWSVLVVEFLAVALLFFPSSRRQGFWLSALLMALFTGYIASMLLFAETIPCSCGGIISSLSWHSHLILNILLLLVATGGILIQKKLIPIPP